MGSDIPRYAETIYSLSFAQSLRLGKYTKWATLVRFSLEDLRTLARIAGEFQAGAAAIIDSIWKPGMQSRALVALQGIEQMVLGERRSPDAWGLRIGKGRGFLRISDLPEAARRGLDAAAPGVKWDPDFLLEVPEGFEALGKDASGKRVFALFSAQGAVSYLGPERRAGEAKDPSVFPPDMRRELAEDKLTRWAVGRVLSAEDARHLLWLADEFACRASGILELLRTQHEKLARERRAVLALEMMCRMVSGERFDVNELERRFERGRARLALEDLPETLRVALKRAAPETNWDSVMMMPGVYLVNGSGPGKLMVGAHLTPGGAVSIFSYIEASELPPPVDAAMKTRLPTQDVLFLLALGPALGKVEHYEIDYREDQEKRTFAISADGSRTWSIDPLERNR
jgi:hypothetical protein